MRAGRPGSYGRWTNDVDGHSGIPALGTLASTLALLEVPALVSDAGDQPFAGVIRYANEACGRLVGVPAQALNGRPLETMLIPGSGAGTQDKMLANLAAAGRVADTALLRRADGSSQPIEWQVTAVPQTPGLWLSVLRPMVRPCTNERRVLVLNGDRCLGTICDAGLFPIMIVRARDGGCVTINEPARTFLGVGSASSESLAAGNLIVPSAEWERIRTLVSCGHVVSGREVRIAVHGTPHAWAQVSAAAIRASDIHDKGGPGDGAGHGAGAESLILLAFHDITRLKATEDALRQRESHVRQLFAEMISAFALHRILCDENGRPVDYVFLEVNPAFEAMTGLAHGAVIGRRVREVLPDLDPFWIDTYGKVALTGVPIHFERYDACLARHFEVAAFSPRRGEFAVTFMDITGRKTFEQTMVAARDAAEQANRSKSQFLATMSHELRTPLISIIGFSELIRDEAGGGGNSAHADYAGEIISSGHHLLALINDILDYSKIESGKMAIDPQWLDGADTVRRCVGLMWERARSRRIALAAALPSGRVWLWADHKALRHIVLNLLANAITFTPADGRVEIGLKVSADGPGTLMVTDTGIGIPEEHMTRILQPFEQGDNRYGRSEGGTGLGLALVKGLVDLHGGTLEIRSGINQGTTVTVHFPVPAGPPPGAVAEGRYSRAGGTSGSAAAPLPQPTPAASTGESPNT